MNDDQLHEPLHLQTLDVVGVKDVSQSAPLDARLLTVTYGLLQLVCTGVPELQNSNRGEAMLATLLRDATAGVAAGVLLLEAGLYEPAMRVARGVLEARLYIQRIRRGDSEKLANLLTLSSLQSKKRHLERQIELKLKDANDPSLRAELKKIKALIKTDAGLKDAGPELVQLAKKNQRWHGSSTIEELAASLGDTDSYELAYSPASALFVHPGDPDVHVIESGDSVLLRGLTSTDAGRLRSGRLWLASEARKILDLVLERWAVSQAVDTAIKQYLPLMFISLDLARHDEHALKNLEVSSGITRDAWPHLVHVSFDWTGQKRE